MPNLKPCPFCGSEEIKILYSKKQALPSDDNGWYARIQCYCGVEVRFWALKKSVAAETVKKTWNRRVGEVDDNG